MPKKYIQLLLSINFCLTAIATATGSDSDANFIVAPDNIEAKLNDQFDYIWHCLKAINVSYPSELLRKLMSQYQSGIKHPTQDDKINLSQKDLDKYILSLHVHLQAFSDKLTKDVLQTFSDRFAKGLIEHNNFMLHEGTLGNQLTEIFNSLQETHNLYQSKEFLSNAEKMILRDRSEELLIFLQRFLTENSTKPLPSIFKLINEFDKIWHHLGKINQIYPSESLQRLVSQYQKSKKYPMQHNANEINQKDLEDNILSTKKAIERLNKNSLPILSKQLTEVCKALNKVYNFCHSKIHLSNEEKAFLNSQLEEILVFSQNFSTQMDVGIVNKETPRLAKREAGSFPFVDESPIRKELDNQFHQIWVCLGEMNTIHQSNLLQELISHHKDKKSSYDESAEEISKEILDNQFIHLQKALKVCSQYQPEEELDEESKDKLNSQLDQIKHYLKSVYEIYDSKKESLSKKEKSCLHDQLEELLYFSSNFIAENSLQANSLDEIQGLLNSCEEEDFLIYPQYESIINSQEANVSDLLKSSQTKNDIQNQFLYFNKAEGLIEIQHIELSEDEEYVKPYTTTWKIRPADVNLVKGWQKKDLITIDKTGFFFKLTMRGESLEYTLNNNKKPSVRANFVCKSSDQNTYTILSIDYLENIVVLKNGPCLFVPRGDLKEWHAKDTVVLQRSGSATDTNSSHKLINKTRGDEKVWIYLKK